MRHVAGDVKIVRTDLTSVAHTGKHFPNMGRAFASGHPEGTLQWRTIPHVEQRPRLFDGHIQQLILVGHDHIMVKQIAGFATIQRTGAHTRQDHGRETVDQEWPHIIVNACFGDFGRTTGGPGHPSRHRCQSTANAGQP